MVALLYRDFEIRKTDPVPPIPGWQAFAWTYCHIDYDGPEDSRIGCCASPEACKAEIDEWHEDIADSLSEMQPPAGERIRSTRDGSMEGAPVTGQSPVGASSTELDTRPA